jgi:hypothetical protein
MTSIPLDIKLYNKIKGEADEKFKSKTGIYKSSWIVREYKKRGGQFKGSKPKSSGLKRWYKEKWIDLNRPIKNSKGKIIGYEKCGRDDLKKQKIYPLCRPSIKVSKKTPRLYTSFSKMTISKAKKQKSKIKEKGNIKFNNGGCNCENNLEDSKKLTGGKRQFYGKRSDIMVPVPKNVKKWAERAFQLRKIGFMGATKTGWDRAKQLSEKPSIPIEDFRYMRNWYARHIITSYPTFLDWRRNGMPETQEWFNRRGILSWVTWGSNPGFNWINSDKAIKLLNRHFGKNYKKIKTVVN